MNKYSLLLLLYLIMPAALAQNSISQGMHSAPVIGGDAVPPPAVPTGLSDNTNGSIFPATLEQIPLTIYLHTDTYSHNTHQYMGKRTVLTIRTNTLNAMKKDLITGILQLDLNTIATNGEHNISIDVNEDQLKQIQNILVSSPSNGRISQQLFHYLPVVRKFCSQAVLLGVVFATIMLAVAAYGIVMNHRSSADKVISTIAGLIVLLMAFTIYSLLIANAANHQSISQTIQSSPLP